MSIYAISDLHLSFTADKKMDVFGGVWEGYTDKIKENWISDILPGDSVIMPGDTSWATYIEDASADFAFIDALPGTKYIFKGNHDYWWTTAKKMEAFLHANGFDTIRILHNDSIIVEDKVFCGTRGWKHPGDDDFEESDRKLYDRELIRLRISLDKAVRGPQRKKPIVVLHYPPFDLKGRPTQFTALINEYGIEKCLYGHIHGDRCKKPVPTVVDGIECINCSADCLGFKPYRLEN